MSGQKIPDSFVTEMLEPSLHNIKVWSKQLENSAAKYALKLDLEDVEIFKRVIRYFCNEEEIKRVFGPHQELINDLRTKLGMRIYE